MAENQDPTDVSFNGIRFADFCDSCREVLLALRLRTIPRGEICQSCAWRLIAAASNPTPPTETPRAQGVIDANLARIMGRAIARPKIEPPIPGAGDQFALAIPGEEVAVFDLRKRYTCALLMEAQRMADLLAWFVKAAEWLRPAHPNVIEAAQLLDRLAAARAADEI